MVDLSMACCLVEEDEADTEKEYWVGRRLQAVGFWGAEARG